MSSPDADDFPSKAPVSKPTGGGPLWLGDAPRPGRNDSPPPGVPVTVDCAALSRQSALRDVNEDHYLITRLSRGHETLLTSLPESALPRHFNEYGYGMVIADGFGVAGERASRLAVATLMHLAICFGRWQLRIDEAIADEVMDRADRFYRSVDATLQQMSHDAPYRLQSTLTAIYTAGTELFYAHAGHSRAYIFRDDELMQLTRDHTVTNDRPGHTIRIAPAPVAPRHPRLATEALGSRTSGAPRIDVERCALLDGDLVLLCTNGLTDVVDDLRIAETLRQHRTPEEQCRALLELTTDVATDDVTALISQYHVG